MAVTRAFTNSQGVLTNDTSGTIIQVVSATDSSARTRSSSSNGTLTLNAAITTTEVNGGSSLTREQDTSNHNVGTQFVFVDSPSTTSATTYTLHGKTENGNQLSLVGNGGISTLTLLEVVA